MKEKMSPGYVLLIILGVVALFYAFSYLSHVLIPFAVAWLLAYILNPVVNFFQNTCRLHFRAIAVILTIILFVGSVMGMFYLVIPPLLRECTNFEIVVRRYYEYQADNQGNIPAPLLNFFNDNFNLRDLLGEDFKTKLEGMIPKLLGLAYSTASAVFSMVASLISLLYMFFLMMDFNRYARIWINWIPKARQHFAQMFVGDIERYVGGYFRGQFFIALSNCIMFSVGFMLFGFPMPIALGCFIGLVSFVPYLQVIGVIPALLLALLRAVDTGDNFWLLMGSVFVVYVVVQVIQDVLVTPKIMGKIMGLSPAIILLSLSIGGALLGILGLILALPVTTMCMLYYRRYVLHDSYPELNK